MILVYFITALITSGFLYYAKTRRAIYAITLVFLIFQAVFCVYASFNKGHVDLTVFTYDGLAIMFFAGLNIVAFATFYHGLIYLNEENMKQMRLYHVAFILLCATVSGVYFSNNAMISWVFIEATIIGSALLIYHRRTKRALEAAWKYVFVCSIGIIIAYLGILFLSTALSGREESSMSYSVLQSVAANANPLFLKLGFVLIIAGYSCKMEFFPLYSIGIDANHAMPAPMSAFFSTAVINMGFISVFRVYKIIAASGVATWANNVLLLTGVVTLLVSSVYLLQVKNYKRLLAYSTVEHMGIVLIALSLGTNGMFFAVFHSLMHTLIKSASFYEISKVGKAYNSYTMQNIGDYIHVSRSGSIIIILCMIGLTAIPPSAFFFSELYTFKGLISKGNYFLFIVIACLICVILYALASKLLHICYGSRPKSLTNRTNVYSTGMIIRSTLLVLFFTFGIYRPNWLIKLIEEAIKIG